MGCGSARRLRGHRCPQRGCRGAALWALRKGATPAQISLAWLLSRKPWVVPIPSTTRIPHLLENLGTEEVTFTAAELAELDTALAGITVHGDRLPAAALAQTGVEAPAA